MLTDERAVEGRPHPGQRYRHGWIPVNVVTAGASQGRTQQQAKAIRDMEQHVEKLRREGPPPYERSPDRHVDNEMQARVHGLPIGSRIPRRPDLLGYESLPSGHWRNPATGRLHGEMGPMGWGDDVAAAEEYLENLKDPDFWKDRGEDAAAEIESLKRHARDLKMRRHRAREADETDEDIEERTGAMIALVPTDDDAKRLAVEDGEYPEDLHLTLGILGEAADFDEDGQRQVIDAVTQAFDGLGPVDGDGFALSIFNHGDDGECLVLGVGGVDVAEARKRAIGVLNQIPDLPAQHLPFVAHVTLAYTDDPSILEEYLDRMGPVSFDRVRIAFADTITDIPLGGTTEGVDPSELSEADPEQEACMPTALDLIRRARESFNPHQLRAPKGTPGIGGRWIKGLLGVGDAPHNPEEHATGRAVARGGSVGHYKLSPRKLRVDDRLVDPSNSRRMGIVQAVYGDGTMRVAWDDGHTETRPVLSVTDPLEEPRRRYSATPGEPPRHMDPNGPAKPRTPEEKAADSIASGAIMGRDRKDLLGAMRAHEPRPTAVEKVAAAKKATPRKAKPDDGLDDMRDDQLKSLAVEFDVPKAREKSRPQLLAALRRKGAASPEKMRERADAEERQRERPAVAPAATSGVPLSSDPEVRDAQVGQRIRIAVAALEQRPGGLVPIADLRGRLDGVPREDVDRVLHALTRDRGVTITAESGRVAPNVAEGAFRLGNRDMHLIGIDAADDGTASRRHVLLARVGEPLAPPPPAAASDPVRAAQIELRIRDAYSRINVRHGGRDGGYVVLSDLRGELGDIPREDVDHVLTLMSRQQGVHLQGENNQKALEPRHRAGAVRIGNRMKHHLSIPDSAEQDARRRELTDRVGATPAKATAPKAPERPLPGTPTDVQRRPSEPKPESLSTDELLVIRDLSAVGTFKDGGWVHGVDVTASRRALLEGLAKKGWVEKYDAGDGAMYRIDPRSIGARRPAESGALVGDVLPPSRLPSPRLSLSRIRRGAIISGYRDPANPALFGNLPENLPEGGAADEGRTMRIVVQRIERVDENGEPTKALLATHRRIIGHDADTGRPVRSDIVSAGSYWDWYANPEDDTSADIEGDFSVVNEPAALSPGTPDGGEAKPARLDVREIGAGIDLSLIPDAVLDSIQRDLDEGKKSRVAIADDLLNTPGGPSHRRGILRQVSQEKLEAELARLRASAARNPGNPEWAQVIADTERRLAEVNVEMASLGREIDARRELAERLKAARRPRKSSPSPAVKKVAAGRAPKAAQTKATKATAASLASIRRDRGIELDTHAASGALTAGDRRLQQGATPAEVAADLRVAADNLASDRIGAGDVMDRRERTPADLRDVQKADVARLRRLADALEGPAPAAKATKATPAKSAPAPKAPKVSAAEFDPDDVAGHIERLGTRGQTEETITEILAGHTSAQIRRIATAYNVPLPKKPPAGEARWTADLLMQYITQQILRDRTR